MKYTYSLYRLKVVKKKVTFFCPRKLKWKKPNSYFFHFSFLKIVFNFHSHCCSLQEKDLEISSRITELQQEITSLKQQHQVEVWQLQERLKKSHGEAIIQKEVMQKQEVSALCDVKICLTSTSPNMVLL